MDLLSQYLSCTFPTMDQAQHLVGAGISARMIVPFVRSALITVTDDLFTFDDEGVEAFVTPVTGFEDGDIETPEVVEDLFDTPVLDLVAWHPDAPGRWALLRGAVAVLGLMDTQVLQPFPTRVHRDVAGWLRAAGDGITILTRDNRERASIVQSISTVAAEDRAHASELIDLARRPVRIPSIIVASRKGAARAWQ